MSHTVTRKYNEQGKLAFVLHAELSEYYKNWDKLVMTEPRVRSLPTRDSEAPWHLQARRGIVLNSGTEIQLRHKVQAWQDASDGKRRLSTSYLRYLPDQQQIDNHHPTKFVAPGHRLSGLGFTGDLDEQVYQLHQQVKGTHHAPP